MHKKAIGIGLGLIAAIVIALIITPYVATLFNTAAASITKKS